MSTIRPKTKLSVSLLYLNKKKLFLPCATFPVIRNYLNEEQNTIPRIGAVAIGGLTGFIFGLRGGIIRRLFYGSLGAGAIAAVCYPKEAEKLSHEGLGELKRYSTIAINFAYGVKPGDEQINLPKIPTSLDEVKESLSGLATSAKKAVFPEK